MKKDNPIREAIDESLSGVRFNAHDVRSVLSAVRSREPEPPPARRRFRLDFAFVLTLLVIVAAPLSLTVLRSRSARIVSVAPGLTTVQPALRTAAPETDADPIAGESEQSEILKAMRACFESLCDTSVFSFDEYTVRMEATAQEDGSKQYDVTMRSVYDNGCSFSAVIAYPSLNVLRHSTPALATQPTFFDDSSDEVRGWYTRYGAYRFAWPASAQAEFSRRYEGALVRESRESELSPEEACSLAEKAVALRWPSVPRPAAYPVLFSERASEDGQARYVVYCFEREVTDALEGSCAVATLLAGSGEVESVEETAAESLAGLL